MCVRLVQTNDVSFLLAGVIGLVLSGGAAALPGGDFNGDGFDDLAIGVPDEDVGLRVDAGAVHVLYGSVGGLRATIASGAPIDARLFTESATWWAGVSPQAGSRFGEALAIGDFNDDGFDDLAISAPGRDIVAVADAGRVYVVYGGHAGLGSGGSWIISEASYARAVGAGDRFGLSLASGDFDGDGADDLVIGAPLDDLDAADAGVAWLAYGAPGGLMLIPRRAPLHLVHWGMTPGPGDMFGWSLAVGNFDSDGYDDLIVGAPGFDRLGVVRPSPFTAGRAARSSAASCSSRSPSFRAATWRRSAINWVGPWPRAISTATGPTTWPSAHPLRISAES
ncbi:MAG: integrin alpha [Phycisphaerales bacterium]|nr:integrin alpha [Phycisphaerales bacterium]